MSDKEAGLMKKSLSAFILLSITLASVFFFWQNGPFQAAGQGPIPQDAIRLRILANSDTPADQAVKRQVRDAVNSNITGWVRDLKSEKQADTVIRSHMPELRQIVRQTLRKVHASETFNIKLGEADFPTKMYGNYVYPAGKYKALVLSLGDGKGANWWCVLFPPLCFLDFSNSEAVRDNYTNGISGSAQKASMKTAAAGRAGAQAKQVEVHSFVFDFVVKLWDAVMG